MQSVLLSCGFVSSTRVIEKQYDTVHSCVATTYDIVSFNDAGADRTLRIAVNMVTKALLQYLMLLAPDPDFPELWSRILQVLQVNAAL